MPNEYLHFEVSSASRAKRPGDCPGDKIFCYRDKASSIVLLADGLGSGIKAAIAAEMALGQFRELLRLGHSFHASFQTVVKRLESAKANANSFSALTALKSRADGMTTLLFYEMPEALLISRSHASILPRTSRSLEGFEFEETRLLMQAGDSVVMFSDGISQAGLGYGLSMGWQSKGVLEFLEQNLRNKTPLASLPQAILDKAYHLWQKGGDDCTVVQITARKGRVVNILSGPPQDPALDGSTVEKFLEQDGIKIVCGGTTAKILARHLDSRLEVENDPDSDIAPPRYKISGIELVTEGAVTLNQVYNLLEEDISELSENSGVTELRCLLEIADRVNIFYGTAKNEASKDVSFKQRGILSRKQILPLIAEKLRKAGKLVHVEEF